jgi:hypothetical protein
MKRVLTIAAVCLMAAPAIGGEVSNQTLSQLGLTDLQAVSDDQGMQIRGFGGYWNKHKDSGKAGGSNAVTSGTSLVFGQLVADLPTGTNFIVVSDVNHAYSSAQNGGFNALSKAGHSHGSAAEAILSVEGFNGTLAGVAGKAASPWGGFAKAYAR